MKTESKLTPKKTDAILRMRSSTNASELRQFLGMANHLWKFTSNYACKKFTDLIVGNHYDIKVESDHKHASHLVEPSILIPLPP